MLVSFSHKFIFVRLPKTAGTSLKSVLAPYCPYFLPPGATPEQLQKADDLKTFCKFKFKDLMWHSHAWEIRDALPPGVYEDFFKFGVVRNPWDWLLSTYSFIAQLKSHPLHETVQPMSFEQYLHWRFETGNMNLYKYVSDQQGECIVDHVARMETLSEEFPLLARRMGIRETGLPRLNKSKHRDYRAMYTDAMAELVAGYFAKDMELFGYDFDGVTGPTKAPSIMAREAA